MKNLSLLIKNPSPKLNSAPYKYILLSDSDISSTFLLKYDLLVLFTTLFLIQETQTAAGVTPNRR